MPARGSQLLLRAADRSGLAVGLSAALAPWRKPLAVHDPGKIVCDLAVSLAVGGDCLADLAQLRAHPQVFGPVASDATVSRLITTLAEDATAALRAIDTARAAARERVWRMAGDAAPDHQVDERHPLIVDVDATLVTAHSDKEQAAPNFKRGFGFHPLCAFVDHGADGTGEPLAMLLRAGNAGSNTAADHIAVLDDALRQLPIPHQRRIGRTVLVRTDAAGATHELLDHLTRRRLAYSVGFTLTEAITTQIDLIPDQAWTPAHDSDGGVREGAWVAELRFTDHDGLRLDGVRHQRPPRSARRALELRHRRRGRCEDRIRCTKATGDSGVRLPATSSMRGRYDPRRSVLSGRRPPLDNPVALGRSRTCGPKAC